MRRTDASLEIALGLTALVCLVLGWWMSSENTASFNPDAKAEHVLRVATWNIGGSAGKGHPALDEYLPNIVETLNTMEADVVLLQEISNHGQGQQLAKMLGKPWSVRTIRTRKGSVGLAWRRGHLRLPATGRENRRRWRSPHGAFMRYRPDASWPWIVVGNLHADPWSAKQRNEAVGQAIRILERSGHDLQILGGDLNLDVDLGKRGDLFTSNIHLDVESYNYIATRFQDAALKGGATAEPDRRLDYLFVSAKTLRVINAGVWKNRRIADMDHDPVITDLILR